LLNFFDVVVFFKVRVERSKQSGKFLILPWIEHRHSSNIIVVP